MIYLQLFWVFFKIGLFSFGGGYTMISLVENEVTSLGWLTKERFYQFLAVSESTPGPLAINMATFVGSSQAGFGGSALATIGVVLPSFIIILLICLLLRHFKNNKYINGFLNGVKPFIIGIIATTVIITFLNILNPTFPNFSGFLFDPRGVGLTLILGALYFAFKFVTKKTINPIVLIVFSACMGMLVYAV